MGTEDRITLAECRVHVEHLKAAALDHRECAAQLRRLADRHVELADVAEMNIEAYRRQAEAITGRPGHD